MWRLILTRGSYQPDEIGGYLSALGKYGWRDSNPRHPVPETGALSAELQPHVGPDTEYRRARQSGWVWYRGVEADWLEGFVPLFAAQQEGVLDVVQGLHALADVEVLGPFAAELMLR